AGGGGPDDALGRPAGGAGDPAPPGRPQREEMSALSLPTRDVLEDVLAATGGSLSSGRRASAFSGVSIDSRSIRPGELFFAIAGPRFDGHDFLAKAAGKGAASPAVHRTVPAPPDLPPLTVPRTP